MKMNLSDEVIAGLEPRRDKYQVTDASVPGLFVLVRPSGVKLLHEMYGSRKYRFNKNIKLGMVGDIAYKEAREKAVEIRAKLKACRNKDDADQVAKEYKTEKRKTRTSEIDGARNLLNAQIRERAIPRPHVNMLFHDGRELMHDFAWPELWIAFNVFIGYSLNLDIRPIPIILNKNNMARVLGWDTYLVSVNMVRDGSAIELISSAVNSAINQNGGIGYENKI